ncbi:hypothetical protein AVEN_28107-1 [Araneus ventricosus]|uniref:Uncharacterized protein n=1 Tax=Araneus ventricosus TaxID=182803 RepID=A0A4Y2MPM6_ARAVE|nr:hypothetical protein AVEN_28107-1 [Araneus ventricosus]
MSSSSLSEEDALEYDMSEDLEDSPAVNSPPPSSKPPSGAHLLQQITPTCWPCVATHSTGGAFWSLVYQSAGIPAFWLVCSRGSSESGQLLGLGVKGGQRSRKWP